MRGDRKSIIGKGPTLLGEDYGTVNTKHPTNGSDGAYWWVYKGIS